MTNQNTYTLQDFAVAFDKWEKEYRSNPTEFLSQEAMAELDVSELSIKCAEYFMQLLNEKE